MRSVSIFYSVFVLCAWRWEGASGGTGSLVSKLRNDANLDLPADEEYEDLRAELLAYHTAFASLAAAERGDAVGPDEQEQGRRSLGSTPCWELGGICIKRDLCTPGNRYLTEMAGCRAKLQVCCFSWNEYKTKDMTAFGINNGAYPWSIHQAFGPEGIQVSDEYSDKDDNKNEHNENQQPPEEKPGSGDEKEKEDEGKKNDIDDFLKTDEDDDHVREEKAKEPEHGESRLRKRRYKKPARPLAIIIKT